MWKKIWIHEIINFMWKLNEASKFEMHNEILHYDLSKDNIMLHFPPNKLDVVYIGVCIWGETRHLQ
jgi:hypothetical protein